jgi:hypothetical protein
VIALDITQTDWFTTVNKSLQEVARKIDEGEASVRFVAKFFNITIDELAEMMRPLGCDISL